MKSFIIKSILICFTGIFCITSAFALKPDLLDKQQEIDSLLKILPTAKDNSRFDILMQLSTIYLSISMDSSREYARLAFKSAKESKESGKIAEAYKLLGNISYYKGNYNNVISYYDSSLMEYVLANDSLGQSKVLNNIGIIYHNLGDFQQSIDFHLRSLDFKISSGDSVGIANSYNNIGTIYYDLNNYEKSSEYFNKALELSLKLGNDFTVQSVMNNLGMISLETGNLEKAIDYFNQSIRFGERIDNTNGVADSYHNLGQAYFYLKKYEKAIGLYQKANALYDKLGIENGNTLNNLGQVYLELDYYKQAHDYLNTALKMAKENNQFILLRNVYQNLSVLYERTGDFKRAHENYMLFNQYDDSIKSQSYSNLIEELITKNKLEKQKEQFEKTILALEKSELEVKRTNIQVYAFLIGLVATLIFIFIVLRLLRQKNKSNQALSQQNEEILRSQEIIKKINKALSDNEEKLRSVFDVSPFTILILDVNKNIIDCNDTSGRMFKTKDKHEILNQKVENFIVFPEDNKTDLLPLINSNQLNKAQFNIKCADHSTFKAELTGRVIQAMSGSEKTYLIVISDISERLKIIENLNNAKLQAEEADRLKTAFLANMSHEIRTPMNSIIGFSNLLNDDDINAVKKNEYISHIQQSSRLLLNLIDDIIDISKIEAGQLNFNLSSFKLNEVVIETFMMFKEANVRKELDFILTLPPGGNAIICKNDPLRLKQVLTNLIGNAEKFTKSGFIDVSYKIIKKETKNLAEFAIRDSGIGIPADKQDIIFDRFRQIDDSQTRNFGGTGLGLAISKKLIESMMGNIWVESSPGKGSTFYFTIPVENPELAGEEKAVISSPSKLFNFAGKTLLVAEDEDSNYELIKAILRPTTVKLIRATNGSEACQMVEKNQSIDLILMDIRMPKMNGYDATRRIKKTHTDIPVIALTAYAMSEDEEKSLLAGCDKYISKPIQPTKLLQTIQKLLNGR